MEKRMEENMENEMERGLIWWILDKSLKSKETLLGVLVTRVFNLWGYIRVPCFVETAICKQPNPMQ